MAARTPEVTVERVEFPGIAECASCMQLDPDSTREQCRRHVEETGHTVRFTIEDVTRYTRPTSNAQSGGPGVCDGPDMGPDMSTEPQVSSEGDHSR